MNYNPLTTSSLLQNSRFLFSKSVKKSVERAGESYARSLFVFSLVPDPLFDCSSGLEYAKIRTFLKSNELAAFYAFDKTWAKSTSLSTLQWEKKRIQQEKKIEESDRCLC